MNKQFIKIIIILMGISMLTAKPYRGGELRTINTYRYGRYEVRMKSTLGSGVVSSFFTYRDFWSEGLTGSQHWNEIDLEWLGNHDDKVQTNLIIQNGWDLPDLINLDFNPHEDFHTYAIEWTPDYVAFFVDEQMIRWVDNFYADSLYHYQKIMMNIWQPTWVDWVGEFDEDILPVYAYYDWVKYYAYVQGTGNAGTDNNFIMLWEDDFDDWDTDRWQKATHTFDNNNVDFIEENVVFYDGYMILCMTTPNNTGYEPEGPEYTLQNPGFESNFDNWSNFSFTSFLVKAPFASTRSSNSSRENRERMDRRMSNSESKSKAPIFSLIHVHPSINFFSTWLIIKLGLPIQINPLISIESNEP